MAVLVNCQLRFYPEKREEASVFFKRILPDTRAYEGCQGLHWTENIEDPSHIEFFSLWDSKEQYDKYLQWRQDSGVMEESEAFLDGDPVWRFFRVDQTY